MAYVMYKEFEVKGAEQVANLLKQLPKRVQKKVAQQALNYAAQPFVQAMKKNIAPFSRTGTLHDSIGRITVRVKNPHLFVAKVGPRQHGSYEGYHGHLVEFGTRHSKPNPFVRPAFIAKRKEFMQRWNDRALDRTMRQIDKIKKSGKVK